MSKKGMDVPLVELIRKVVKGIDLSALESEVAFDRFMDGSASEIEMAGLLAALQTKGANHREIAGGIRALRKAMVRVYSSEPERLVDTAGTGGGTVTTFNISTAAALVAAGAGIPIAKHGNRSFTSRSGSADVLEALGVDIDLSPERIGEILEEVGIVFMFAPLLHPAMRHVGPVRRTLGITTIMNILGPLTNPAGALRQVMGVADPSLRNLVARALKEIGHLRALVVYGDTGMDEISHSGVTHVTELSDSEIVEYQVTPEQVGLEPAALESLVGGDPEDNALVIQNVLRGEEGGARTAVVLNAAAAIFVAGRSVSLQEGVQLAESSIDSGAASDALERLKIASSL